MIARQKLSFQAWFRHKPSDGSRTRGADNRLEGVRKSVVILKISGQCWVQVRQWIYTISWVIQHSRIQKHRSIYRDKNSMIKQKIKQDTSYTLWVFALWCILRLWLWYRDEELWRAYSDELWGYELWPVTKHNEEVHAKAGHLGRWIQEQGTITGWTKAFCKTATEEKRVRVGFQWLPAPVNSMQMITTYM